MKPTQTLLKFSQHTTLRTQMTHIDLSITMYLRGRGDSKKAVKTYLKKLNGKTINIKQCFGFIGTKGLTLVLVISTPVL